MNETIQLLFNNFLVSTGSLLPTLLSAIGLFIIGYILASWAKKAIIRLAIITRVSQLSKNPAIQDFLKNAQIGSKVENILGEVIRWMVILFFTIAAANLLGLNSVSMILNNVFVVIPSIIAALVILFIGVLLSGFFEKIVKGSLGASDPSLSRFAGRVVSYTTMTIFILIAMAQLGIASFFIQITYIGFILTLTLALGIGIGLGSKDVFKEILERWYKKVQK